MPELVYISPHPSTVHRDVSIPVVLASEEVHWFNWLWGYGVTFLHLLLHPFFPPLYHSPLFVTEPGIATAFNLAKINERKCCVLFLGFQKNCDLFLFSCLGDFGSICQNEASISLGSFETTWQSPSPTH